MHVDVANQTTIVVEANVALLTFQHRNMVHNLESTLNSE